MFSISVVPTGLVLNLMHNPGTEVPGYSRCVPTGRKPAKLQRPEGPAINRPGLTAGPTNYQPFGPQKPWFQNIPITRCAVEMIFRLRDYL